MTLREELERTDNWLFKWRSYMPLLMIFLVFLAALEFKYPGQSHKIDHVWEMICLAISFVGLIIRILTVGYVPGCTSVRETKEQVAEEQVAETLNTTGMYSIVRHPLYLGNFIIWFGLSLILFKWWFVLIVCLVYWVYYERIIFSEEEFLRRKFGDTFIQWADQTPAFIPKFKNWKIPKMSFCWRTVLRRESSSFFALVSSYTFIEITVESFANGKFVLENSLIAIFGVSLLLYFILIVLKRGTHFLRIEGR